MNNFKHMNKWILLLSITTICTCSRHSSKQYTVCLNLNTESDNTEAKRGIDWWHESITYSCDPQSSDAGINTNLFITVKVGTLESNGFAMGYTDSVSEIVWIKGNIFTIVRHEFGHVLGYKDSAYGVMYSGSEPESLTPQM
jgi:hypothetical protein